MLQLIRNPAHLRSFAPWIALGLAVHVAGFVLLRIEMPPSPNVEPIHPFVSWVAADTQEDHTLFHEQSRFMDSAVLFMPLRSPFDSLDWNTPGRGHAMRFAAIEPNIQLHATAPAWETTLSQGEVVTRPEDLLATRFWRLFDRISFADLPAHAASSPTPKGYNIVHWRANASIETPNPEQLPEFEHRRGRLLAAPADMVFHLDERGLSGRPVRLSDPGNQEFLDHTHTWLHNPALHYPLSPGPYLIRLFP